MKAFEIGPVSVTFEDRIAVVTLRRGDRLNALSVEAIESLREVAFRLREDFETTAVVLTGDPVFSAGADLSDPGHKARRAAPLLQKRELLRLAPTTCAAWEALDQLTIVAIEGFCLGGALALAVSCDFRIAGRGSHVRLPEIPLGWNLNWNATPRILNLVGPSRAKQLIIFGERVYAEEAHRWGVIDEVAEDGEALACAMRWARKAAALPPLGVRMSKRTITEQVTTLNRLTCHMDNDQYILASMTEDHQEAIAAFFEKRPPNFKGA
ncbi:enoyl-CoA hydratase/isomerase family protein [Tardiphaga sp. 862_B3_N1_1]|uniref:enoyl-CoA hydratase/isomerase family protein n=1 Tax=Tardiphaga sp. 862_B3_N1_1 TaxID=3240763 RepID=UPI003F8C0A8D